MTREKDWRCNKETKMERKKWRDWIGVGIGDWIGRYWNEKMKLKGKIEHMK